MKKRIGIALFALAVSLTAAAQSTNDNDSRNEFGFTIGGEAIPGNSTQGELGATTALPITFSFSIAFQLHYAHRLVRGNHAALYFEVPAVAASSHTVSTSAPAAAEIGGPAIPVSLGTFYVTPSFRVNFAPNSRLTPWFSFGGGYGLYESSEALGNGAVNPDRFTNTATAVRFATSTRWTRSTSTIRSQATVSTTS